MKRIISGVIALTLLASLGLAGASCVPIVQAKTGTIEVRVTDKPPEYGEIEAIWVTVVNSEEEGVAVHKAATEEDGDGGWRPIPITGDNPFELLALQAVGVDALLGWNTVPAGKYTQIRMTISEVKIYFEGEDEPILAELPSGKLKFVRPFDVVDGETTIIMLDFIADKSVVFAGANKVIFKPVVKLSIEYGEGEEEEEEELLGTIAGTVTDSSDEPIEGATVVVEGTELSATTDGDGDYEIADVPEATYTATASAAGYDDDSQSVTVIAGETSTADFALNPIPTTGTIAGNVTDSSTGLAIEGATVTDGTRSAITDVNGDYTIADVPEATYAVTASAAGYDDDSQSVTVIAGETSTADFTLEPSA